MASSLTPEQRARIELNRKLALEKRAARLQQITSSSPEKFHKTYEKSSHSTTFSKSEEIESKKNPTLATTSNQIQTNFISCNTTEVNSSSNSAILNITSPNSFNSNTKQTNLVSFYKSSSNPPNKVNSSYPPLDLNVKQPNNSNFLKKTANASTSVTPTPITPQNTITGICRLISKERFVVDILYQQQIVDLFRTVNGREYDAKTKLWTFPVKEYFNLKRAISVLKPHVIVGNLPKCIVETFITKAREIQQDISKVDISRIDEKLRQTIYPFQKEGIQFGISKGGRCLIADDMGLGKSIQALGIADYYRCDWPMLIVCPSSMRFQWEEEIRVNLPNSVHSHQIFVMTTAKDNIENAKILILSYDLLGKKKDLIKNMGFGVVIMDESHSIKSSKTQRGKAALEVAQHCKRVILLSGTPAVSRPVELFTQIQAVDPSAFSFFKEYGMRYCDGKQTNFGWDFNGSSNMEELRLFLEARIMIRRLKSNVLTQLPSKIRQVIVLNNQSLKKNSEAMSAFALKLQSTSLRGSERHGTLLSYFSETANTKSSAVCEYIQDLLEDDRKILCFAHHAVILDAICTMLEKNKTFYIRIDGTVSAEDRKILCEKFQYEEKWKVAVLSIKAANTGLTLTAAQLVVFAELFWNPGDLLQAEDRVHRIGQEDYVVIKYLLAKGTADDYLWPLIQSKLEVLNKAGLSKDSYKAADTKCLEGQDKKRQVQQKMDDFVEKTFSDEDNMISDEDLLKVMDEIDGIPEKKMKLDFEGK